MKRRPMILVSLLLAAFVINLDTTIVNVALPTLVRQLHASNSQLQWIVDAYNLLFAGSVLAAGSLSDRMGRKGMLLAGLAVFGLASFAGGLMTTADQLIAARCVMGLGAAMIFPATLSLISNVFVERRERARAIGLWGATAGFALAALLLAAFVARERGTPAPLLDIGLFRNLRFTAASGSVTVVFFSLAGFIFLITQYFQFFKGYGPLSTGVHLLPVATSVG